MELGDNSIALARFVSKSPEAMMTNFASFEARPIVVVRDEPVFVDVVIVVEVGTGVV